MLKWITVSVYVLVAVVKKRLNLPRSLYENLQTQIGRDGNTTEPRNQMNLFD